MLKDFWLSHLPSWSTQTIQHTWASFNTNHTLHDHNPSHKHFLVSHLDHNALFPPFTPFVFHHTLPSRSSMTSSMTSFYDLLPHKVQGMFQLLISMLHFCSDHAQQPCKTSGITHKQAQHHWNYPPMQGGLVSTLLGWVKKTGRKKQVVPSPWAIHAHGPQEPIKCNSHLVIMCCPCHMKGMPLCCHHVNIWSASSTNDKYPWLPAGSKQSTGWLSVHQSEPTTSSRYKRQVAAPFSNLCTVSKWKFDIEILLWVLLKMECSNLALHLH